MLANLALPDSSWTSSNPVKVGWRLKEGWNCTARCAALQRKRLGVITVKHRYSVIFGSATGEGEEEKGKEGKKKKSGTDDVAKTGASSSEMFKMTRTREERPQHLHWGWKIFRMSTEKAWCPLAPRQALTAKYIVLQHGRQQFWRGNRMITETFHMPLDSEVEAN